MWTTTKVCGRWQRLVNCGEDLWTVAKSLWTAAKTCGQQQRRVNCSCKRTLLCCRSRLGNKQQTVQLAEREQGKWEQSGLAGQTLGMFGCYRVFQEGCRVWERPAKRASDTKDLALRCESSVCIWLENWRECLLFCHFASQRVRAEMATCS